MALLIKKIIESSDFEGTNILAGLTDIPLLKFNVVGFVLRIDDLVITNESGTFDSMEIMVGLLDVVRDW